MRPRTIAVAIGIGALLCVGAAPIGAESPAPSGSFGFDITVKPQGTNSAAFVCEAALTDLASGEVLFQPRITARSRDEARATSTFKGGEATYQLLLSVRVDNLTATYSMEVRRNDTLVFRSAGSTTVAAPPRA